jgi:hypothetical protein
LLNPPPHRSARQLFAQQDTTQEAQEETAQKQTTLVTLEQQLARKSRARRILSLNKMQDGIIRIMEQFSDGAPLGSSGVNSKWRNDYGVLAREKCKIVWSNWGAVPESEKDALWEQIKRHYIFPTDVEHQEFGKSATIRIPYHREYPSKVQIWTQQVLCSDW